MKTSPLQLLRKIAALVASPFGSEDTSIQRDGIEDGRRAHAESTQGKKGDPTALQTERDVPRPSQIQPESIGQLVHTETTIDDFRTVVPTTDELVSIDHFEIRQVLGRGGFGSVYLAYDTRLDRMVALKVLDKVERSAARRMLEHETRAASRLAHPNLVTIFQSGETKRGCYIVFEYVSGPEPEKARTLRDLIADDNGKRIGPETVVDVIRQATAGLAYAHASGVVHRDIKPENILIDYKGAAHLADFGCARQSKRYHENGQSLVGTLPYMSLDQIDGRWNAQTDVWSIGVVLYEALAGKRPFEFAEQTHSRSAPEAAFSFAVAVLTANIEPIEGVDQDLMAICRTCLATDAADRYDSADTLLEDLARWQRNEPVSCRPISFAERARRWSRRNPVVATQCVAIGLLLVTGLCVSSYFATHYWRSRHQYVVDQVAQLSDLDDGAFDSRIETLSQQPFRETSRSLLQSAWQRIGATEAANGDTTTIRTADRLAVAILKCESTLDPTATTDQGLRLQVTHHLQQRLLDTDDASEFLFVRRHLLPTDAFVDSLWSQVDGMPDVNADANAAVNAATTDTTGHSLGALAALASYDPQSDRWTDQRRAALASAILARPPSQIAKWTATISEISDQMTPLFWEATQSNNGELRDRAERAYATLATSPSERIQRMIASSSPELVRETMFDLAARDLSIDQRNQIAKLLNEFRPDRAATEVANQSLAKLIFVGPAVAADLTVFDRMAPPDARHLFELNAARAGLSMKATTDWLNVLLATETQPDAIQSAILALGHFNPTDTATELRKQAANQLTHIRRDHPFANVHAAAERVLRQWNEPLPKLNQPTFGNTENGWRINELGHLMVRRRLSTGLVCEVSAYEITVEDYARYVEARAKFYGEREPRRLSSLRAPLRNHLKQHGPSDFEPGEPIEADLLPAIRQMPITTISALQAITYCVWASEQTGVPPNQLGFEVRKQDGSSTLVTLERNLEQGTLSAPIEHIDQTATGYRLPFLDEWRLLTSRDVNPSKPGTSPTALVREQAPANDQFTRDQLAYDEGWYVGNSKHRLHDVGTRRPNQNGIFDLSGNAAEWYLTRDHSADKVVDPNSPATENRTENSEIVCGAVGGRYSAELGLEIVPIDDVIIFSGDKAIGYRLFRRLQ